MTNSCEMKNARHTTISHESVEYSDNHTKYNAEHNDSMIMCKSIHIWAYGKFQHQIFPGTKTCTCTLLKISSTLCPERIMYTLTQAIESNHINSHRYTLLIILMNFSLIYVIANTAQS